MHKLLLGAAALALVGGTAFAQDKVVNVYNWSDYIDEEILAEFTAETGIKVVYDVFDSNDILETKLLAGSSGYDVVVPSGGFLQRQIQAGVFQKLDKSKLSNLGNMWDAIEARTALYDPGNEYSVNYMWGTTGIGYNVDAVKARRRLRGSFSRRGGRDDPGGAELSGARSGFQGQGVDRGGGGIAGIDPSACDQLQFVDLYQCAGRWRCLSGDWLVGRYIAGARPCCGSR
jgi:hypothetical protein